MKIVRCDFCNALNPRWSCPCANTRTFAVDTTTRNPVAWQDNLGEWLACDTCVKFIERSERTELAAHCAKQWFVNRGEDPDDAIVQVSELADIIYQMQAAYWKHATGAPMLYEVYQ